MKQTVCLSLFFALFIAGCTTKPTAYVYAKYLSDIEKERLIKTFEQSDKFNMELNEFDVPVEITESTMLYSLLLRDPNTISEAAALAESAGFVLQRTQALTQGNHWYTKDSLALFLIPKRKGAVRRLFKQDLVHHYEGQRCGEGSVLTLNKNGTFALHLRQPNAKTLQLITGEYKYRQYPFIELQKDSLTYAEYYFEIEQFSETDQISKIDFIKLVSINPGSLPKECSFIIGTRR